MAEIAAAGTGTGMLALATQYVETAGGRRIAFSELGDPTGRPVLYLHGFPSSRREALLLHDTAVAAGARIITSDRPGYGDSDDDPARTIADWPDDLVRLADHLGIERFALLGVSGGGPYAAAAAWRIPRLAAGRLAGCAMVCPLGPIYIDDVLRAMNPAVRLSLGIGRWPRRLGDILLGRHTTGLLQRLPGLVEKVRHLAAPPADREVLREGDNGKILNATVADAMQNGGRGARRDLFLYTHDWHIPFAEIDYPVEIWHGQADGTVPIDHARWYGEHLPNARLNEIPNEGHYSVPLRYSPRILDALLAGLPKADAATA